MVNINYIHKDFFYCQNIENKALHFRSKLLPCCFLCVNYDNVYCYILVKCFLEFVVLPKEGSRLFLTCSVWFLVF